MKSLRVCHWYVEMSGAWFRIYYALCSKTYSTFGSLFWFPASSRRAARNARICETRLLNTLYYPI